MKSSVLPLTLNRSTSRLITLFLTLVSLFVFFYFLLYMRKLIISTPDTDDIHDMSPSPPRQYNKAQDYIARNEEVRQRFLDKRQKHLFGTRHPGEIGPWEGKDGATTIWNFFPPTFTCPHLVERIGTPADGGKWVCGVSLFENKLDGKAAKDCIVYSFGVASESTFEMELLERTSCQIFAYDPSVRKMNLEGLSPLVNKSRIKFTSEGLSSRDELKMHTLGHLMRQNGHDYIDFIKIDVEGWEFSVISQMANEFKDTLPFGHLNMEVHMAGAEKQKFKQFYEMYGKMEALGMRAFVWEDNHNSNLNGRMPDLMEYGFVNIKHPKNQLLKL